VSSDDTRKDGRNLASQLEMCREHAQRKGYEIVAEMPEDDRGASGAALDLPQLNRALEMARGGLFDVLVVREIDRFARRLAKQLIVEEELRRANVEIDYVLGEYPDTPEGNLMKNVKASVAEYERLKIAERSKRGRRNIARSGKVMLHGDKPPYGYRVNDKAEMIVYEPEAKIVRMIFDWYVNGNGTGERMSAPKIATRLSEMDIPTWVDIHAPTYNKQRRYGVWSGGVVAKILRRELYKGVWYYGKQTPDGYNPREDWIAVDVPAIVSEALWDAARRVAKRNRTTAKRNVKNAYLMRYRLTCSCGYSILCEARHLRMADGHMKHYLYYRCSGIDGSKVRKCSMPSFRTDQVDATIWAWVRDWLLEPGQLTHQLQKQQAEREQQHAPLNTRLGVIDDLLAKNGDKMTRLLDLYLDGEFERDMLVARHAQLEKMIVDLEQERADLMATLQAGTLSEAQIATILDVAREIHAHLEGGEADFERRRNVIEMLDVRGVLQVEDGGQKVIRARSNITTLQRDVPLSDVSPISKNQ